MRKSSKLIMFSPVWSTFTLYIARCYYYSRHHPEYRDNWEFRNYYYCRRFDTSGRVSRLKIHSLWIGSGGGWWTENSAHPRRGQPAELPLWKKNDLSLNFTTIDYSTFPPVHRHTFHSSFTSLSCPDYRHRQSQRKKSDGLHPLLPRSFSWVENIFGLTCLQVSVSPLVRQVDQSSQIAVFLLFSGILILGIYLVVSGVSLTARLGNPETLTLPAAYETIIHQSAYDT